MDFKPNESINKNFAKSQINFMDSKMSHNKTNELNYKTSKLFNVKHFPSLKSTRSTSNIRHGYNYALRETKLGFNSMLNNELSSSSTHIEYDSKTLKNDLSEYKTDIHKKKIELSNLKIKYSKLLEENNNNKSILANILSLSSYNHITKSVLIEKIENCQLTKENREILEDAYNILLLKLEISNKKKKIVQQNNFIEELKKNSKTKVINQYQNEYYTKCEQQRSLLDTLKKLEDKCDYYEKKISEINEKMNNDKIKDNKLLNKQMEINENLSNILEKKNNLVKHIEQLDDKIKKQEKLFNDKEKDKKVIERKIYEGEQKLKIINNYKSNRKEQIKKLENKMKIKDEQEKELKEQEKQIQQLSKQNYELNEKMENYNIERPKLIIKGKESKKDIEKMKFLEEDIKNLYKKKEEEIKMHKEKQEKLKKLSEEETKKNEENDKSIKNNNSIRANLNNIINELISKISVIDDKNGKIEKDLEIEKNKFDKLNEKGENLKKQNEMDDLEYTENQQKLEEERKKELNKKSKEYKRELDKLKKTQNVLKSENNNLTEENKRLQNEIEEFNQSLVEFDQKKEEYNQAKMKLESLKGNS